MAIAPADLSGLPSLGNFPVSPYEGLQQISTEYGLGPQFGGVDYIAARQAGYNDAEIIAFLKANPQLDTNNVSGRLAAGQGPAIIQGALGNISGSDPNRAAIANPNQAPSVPVGATLGTGGQDWVPVANNVNINVQGNQDYASMMYANSRGTLDVAAQGGGEDGNSYFIFDSATGKIFAGITPVQSANGYTAYQFSYPNPNSRGTISEYVIANDSTGIVSPINTNSQLAYTPGAGGGFLAQSGLLDLFSKALPIISFAIPGVGSIGATLAEELGLASMLGVTEATAAQIGSALLNVGTQLAQGKDLSTALQNTAISSIVSTGSTDLAKQIISAGANQTVANALVSGVGSAANAALTGGNSQQALESAILGAAQSAVKTNTSKTPSAQVAAADTGTTTDVTAPTTGTIPSSTTDLSKPPGVPANAVLGTDNSGNPAYIDYATGSAYDQAGNRVPGFYMQIDTTGTGSPGTGTIGNPVTQGSGISIANVPSVGGASSGLSQSLNTNFDFTPSSQTASSGSGGAGAGAGAGGGGVPSLDPISATVRGDSTIGQTSGGTSVPQLEQITATLPPVPQIETISVTAPKGEADISSAPIGTDATPEQPQQTVDENGVVIAKAPKSSKQATAPAPTTTGTQTKAGSAALSQALNLGNLGDPFFTKTGKKPRYVWNEASLRTGNETGVQSG